MANLYDKAGLVNIPVGYQEGFLYNIKPEDNTLAFRFNRDSAATLVNKEGLIEQVGYFGPELVQNGNFNELGPELVVNGDFATDSDWNLSNATISNGQLKINSVTGEYSGANQSILTIGKQYKLNIKVEVLSGGLNLYSGSGSPLIAYISQSGEYTYYFTAQALDGLLILVRNTSGDNILVDSVSVKQVDPNDYWSLGNGWGFGDDKAIYNGSGYSSIEQSISDLSSKKIKVQFDIVDYISGTIRINPVYRQDGADVRISGNGTYTQIYTSTADKISFQPQLFVGSITNISVIEVIGDKPRIDYTDSLTSPSFLLEPQSTNLLTYSEDFTEWTNTRSSDLSGFISPSGENNATKFISDNTASSSHIIKSSNFTISSGQKYTYSVFVKANQLNYVRLLFTDSSVSKFLSVYFNLTNGTVGATSDGSTATLDSSNIENFGNGWFRCSVSGDLDTTTTAHARIYLAEADNDAVFDGDGTSSIYIWGAMVEQQSYATSYIPTSGSTATRAQETCNGAGNASTFNSTEGVLYAEIAALADDETNRRITISDGTNANRVVMGYNTNSNQIFYFVIVNNSTVANGNYTSSDITQFSKIAIKFEANNFSLWVDGIERHTDTNGAIFSQDTLTSLQFEQGAGNSLFFYGKTKGVYVFNEALTDDELQQLTGPEYNSFAALAAAYNYTVI